MDGTHTFSPSNQLPTQLQPTRAPGKALGKPVWELLLDEGKSPQESITPYASLQPNGSSYEEYKQSLVAWAVKAKSLGFVAGKMECTLTGPYNHTGLSEDDPAKVTEVVAAVRKAVGTEKALSFCFPSFPPPLVPWRGWWRNPPPTHTLCGITSRK